MGYWGYLPFQNDYVLDDFGGYTEPKELASKYHTAITSAKFNNNESYIATHEIAGAILSTLRLGKEYSFLSSDASITCALQAMKVKKLTDEIYEALHESLWTFICTAAIPFETRRNLLRLIVNKTERSLVTGKLANSFKVDTKTHEIIDIHNKNKDEEYSCIALVYNKALQLVQSNFKDIEPLELNPNLVKWLYTEYEKYRKNYYVQNELKKYTDDLIIITLGAYYNIIDDIQVQYTNKLCLENSTLLFTPKITGPSDDTLVELENTYNIKYMTLEEFLHTYYPNGFYAQKSGGDDYEFSLLSIDKNTKLALNTEDKKELIVPRPLLRRIAKHVPVYTNKAAAIKAIKTKSVDNSKPQLLKIKVLNRFYIKENGKKVTVYIVTDGKDTRNIRSEVLKDTIRNNKVNCINATLTSDNRLIIKEDN